MRSDTIMIDSRSAEAFAEAILVAHGVPHDRATSIASALVLADLRGVDSHGLNRLPGYIDRVVAGVVDPAPRIKISEKSPVMALVDANNTFGFIAGKLAVDKGIEMAKVYGMGAVAVRNSNHYGMGATYVLHAVRQGFACLA